VDKIILAIPDLMFETRVADVARKLGHRVETYSAADIGSAQLVILGLENYPTWRAIADMARAKNVPILAFAGHTKANLLHDAREAGCTRVVVKSDVAENLPRLIEEIVAAQSK
jgi:hypothetical protein